MFELETLMGRITVLLAGLGGGASVIMVCYAGLQWILSGGDPQGMAKAKMGLLGALGGLIVVGLGFVSPVVVNEVVIEPVGGVGVVMELGLDCDDVLRRQLVFQRAASNAERMNMVIREVQATKVECALGVWNAHVDDSGYSVAVGKNTPNVGGPCFSTPPEVGAAAKVGDLIVPAGLRIQGNRDLAAREASGRDRENNIIVYWGDGRRRPNDEAGCWLYVASLRTWESGH